MIRRRQRGSILLYGLLALFVATAGAGIVYTYKSAITRAESAEKEREVWQRAADQRAARIAELVAEDARKDKLLAARQTQRNVAAAIERRVDDALRKAFQSVEARAWADVVVPRDVVDSLRLDARPSDRSGTDPLPTTTQPAAPAPGR
jgi:hypothetical protein